MKEMFFKSILISDINKNVARFKEFSKGINVVTSKENHVGKSSLIKSLYYSLGAEVEYDTVWDKDAKIYIADICVNGDDYTVVRFQKRFAVLKEDKLILLTKSVTNDLAKIFEEIFSFSIYLPNKKTKKIEMAPPVFSFMPYYIDQDNGWTGLYQSFSNIEQYGKSDREKSLYYHLNIYDKNTITLMARRDEIRSLIENLKKEQEKIQITIDAILEEVGNLIPADSMEELEYNLKIPKKAITDLVEEIGEVRNKIQTFETMMQQHEHQLTIINEYKKISKPSQSDLQIGIHECPNCGYSFDEEIYDMVRSNYNLSNEDYMCQQIQLIIESIKADLDKHKVEYVGLMKLLEENEKSFDDSKDSYELYIKQRGLQKSVKSFTNKLEDNISNQVMYENAIKGMSKELKKLTDKKDIEGKYVEFVEANILKLDAWNSAYDGKIKLIKPMKAQGTLETKIILSQFIGLFQTMNFFDSKSMRFPFIVDSPRAKEPSFESSKAILKQILELDVLPQVILATMDFEDFGIEVEGESKITVLSDKRSLLNAPTYQKYKNRIEQFYELLKNFN
ncbi:MAG: hypothetical protein ACRC0V_11600 [Fusobacteriaceae bacterium]